MQVGMAKYDVEYKDADVLLLEPDPDDAEMFFANVFSYANRRRVCDHAYRNTVRDLVHHAHRLEPLLARHGITLRLDLAHLRMSPSLRRISGKGVRRELGASLAQLDDWVRAQRGAH